MTNCFLMEMTVAIPEKAIIRNGKRVEYELERTYSSDTKDSRVVRRMIGKVDPVNPGRMFPNEMYFQLFPENEVPEEVREEFLRGCEIKRQMNVIRSDPDRIIDGVVNGLSELGGYGRNGGDGSLVPHSWNCERPSPCSALNYVMIRRLFDDVYYSVEELAGKYPNEVMVGFKVKQINEVLGEIRKNVQDERTLPYLQLIDEPEETTDKEGKTVRKGLSYSDVLMMLKWYKVLPR